MKKIWIVVANSTYSHIYRAENNQKLVEIKYLEHLESHMRARELVSDSQGRSTNVSLYGSDTMEDKTSLKDKESMHFADQIITFLEEGCKNGECERIYIISKAPFLGNLRAALPPLLAKLVHAEISKDLTQLTADQVREYLPPVL
jgi:protein required for attachment to host cells